jgi:hypothetical protein
MAYTIRSGATVTAQVNWTDINNSSGEVSGVTTCPGNTSPSQNR